MQRSSSRTQFVIMCVGLALLGFMIAMAISGARSASTCDYRMPSPVSSTPGLMPHASDLQCVAP